MAKSSYEPIPLPFLFLYVSAVQQLMVHHLLLERENHPLSSTTDDGMRSLRNHDGLSSSTVDGRRGLCHVFVGFQSIMIC